MLLTHREWLHCPSLRITIRVLFAMFQYTSDPVIEPHPCTLVIPSRGSTPRSGNIKSAITGTCRKLGPDHAERYLASFAWRYNRRYQLQSMIPRFLHSAARTQPIPYRALIADWVSWISRKLFASLLPITSAGQITGCRTESHSFQKSPSVMEVGIQRSTLKEGQCEGWVR